MRECIPPALVALIVASLFWAWVNASFLSYATMSQWHALGVLGLAAAAIVLTRWTRHVFWSAVAAAIGVLLGGTWAEFTFPNDVRPSLGMAALTTARVYWVEMVIAAVVFGLAGVVVNRRQRRC